MSTINTVHTMPNNRQRVRLETGRTPTALLVPVKHEPLQETRGNKSTEKY